MSKFDECMADYKSEAKRLGLKINESLLEKVAKGLGPSIYNNDSSKVSCSDQSELDRVKANFLVKKLGLADNAKLDSALQDVCNTLGSSNRNKYRALFYYLLVEKFNKASVYG